MDLNKQAELISGKTLYDAILLSINATCAEWSLLPVDLRVIVTMRTFVILQYLESVHYPNVFFKASDEGFYKIGIAETELIVETKHHFVKGEMPFKIMAI
jgi:hypothetical protein